MVVVESVPQGAGEQSSVQVKPAPDGPLTACAYKFVLVPGLIWALSLQTDVWNAGSVTTAWADADAEAAAVMVIVRLLARALGGGV